MVSNFPYPRLRLRIRQGIRLPIINLVEKNGISKTDRGGTLKRLLLHTTPRLKESG